MNYNNDEIEIDLIAVLWRMAAQWRLIFLMGLCCAVLFFGFSYLNDKRAYIKWQEDVDALSEDDGDEEGTSGTGDASAESKTSESDGTKASAVDSKPAVPDMMEARNKAKEKLKEAENDDTTYEAEEADNGKSNLSSEEKRNVELLVDKQAGYDDYENYINNSLLYDIDPYHKKGLYLRYRLTQKGDNLVDETGAALTGLLYSPDTLEKIASTLGGRANSQNILELYSATYEGMHSQLSDRKFVHEGIVNISAVVTDEFTAEEWKEAITQAVNENTKDGSDISNAADVEPFDERTDMYADMDLQSKQNTARNNISSNNSEIVTAVKGYSDEQFEYYSSLVSENNLSDKYVTQESERRRELAEKVTAAKNAAEKAAEEAKKAQETALTLTEYATKAEERSELAAARAEEAAIEAAKAEAKDKQAKADNQTAIHEQELLNATDDADAAGEAADDARKAAARALSAAEASQLAADEAKAAVGEADIALELRDQAAKAAEEAAEIAQKAQTKADEAAEAATAAQSAVELVEAANAASTAEAASEEAAEASKQLDESAEDLSELQDEDDEETEVVNPPAFRIRNLIIGALLGLFVYGVILVIWLIFRPKVNQETCSGLLSDKRTIRLHEKNEPKGFKEQLLNDPYIYRIRNKNLPELNVQLDNAVSSIKFFTEMDGAVSPVLISFDRLSDKCMDLGNRLVSCGSRDGVEIKLISLDEADKVLYYETIKKLKDIFIVSEYEITDVRELYRKMEELNSYGIRLEGNIVLG